MTEPVQSESDARPLIRLMTEALRREGLPPFAVAALCFLPTYSLRLALVALGVAPPAGFLPVLDVMLGVAAHATIAHRVAERLGGARRR